MIGARLRRAAMTWALVVCGVVGAPEAARAMPDGEGAAVTDEDLTRLFQEGLDRFDRGDARGAIDVWAPLVEREPDRAWRALYNLGLAYEAVGDLPAAVAAYDRFVKRVGQLPGSVPDHVEERRQDAVDRATALKASLGVVRVRSDAVIAGVLVSIDGGPTLPLPVETFVSPGAHRVVAIAGERSRTYETDVVKGGASDVVVLAGELAPPPTKPPPKPLPRPTTDAPVGFPVAWVVAGAGLTALSFALPIGFGIDAWNQGNAAGALGPGHTRYAAAADAYVSARTRYYAMYAVPAVLAAATATVAIVGAVRARGATVDPADASMRVDVAVVPLAEALTPNGALVSVAFQP